MEIPTETMEVLEKMEDEEKYPSLEWREARVKKWKLGRFIKEEAWKA